MRHFFSLLLVFPLLAFSQTDFRYAEKLFFKGDYHQAQVLFTSILKDNPDHVQSLEYLGDINSLKNDWEKAIPYYEKLKQLQPRKAIYYYKYGGAMAMLAKKSNKIKAFGMITDIRESFEKAIALNPKHIEARWALIELYLALPGIFGGSETKAAAYADELLKISPVDGYLAKGRIAEYFERFPIAEKYYKLAVETGGSKTTYNKLAELYKNKMNKPEKARATLAEFSQKNKS